MAVPFYRTAIAVVMLWPERFVIDNMAILLAISGLAVMVNVTWLVFRTCNPVTVPAEARSVKKFIRRHSSGFVFVIFEQATQPLPASQLPMFPTSTCPCWQREQQQVLLPLVISFLVIVFLIVMQRAFEGRLAKKNQLREALLLDRSDPSFRKCIEVRTLRRQGLWTEVPKDGRAIRAMNPLLLGL